MLTLIGIGVVVLALIGWYLVNALVITQTATYTVVMDISGQRPIRLLPNGWTFIGWPFEKKGPTIGRDQFTYNMPKMRLNCQVDDPIIADQLRRNGNAALVSGTRVNALAEVETREVSLVFQLYFWRPGDTRLLQFGNFTPSFYAQLSHFFELVKFKADGSLDMSRLQDERIKDALQALFTEAAQGMQIYDAMNFPKTGKPGQDGYDGLTEIQRKLQIFCLEQELPIRILALHRNARFEPVGEIGKAIDTRAAAAVQLETQVVQEEARRRVAELAVETERAKGQQVQVRIAAILKAYGLEELPRIDQVARLMDLETLDVYRKMAESGSGKFVIMPDMLGKIGGALAALTQGGNR